MVGVVGVVLFRPHCLIPQVDAGCEESRRRARWKVLPATLGIRFVVLYDTRCTWRLRGRTSSKKGGVAASRGGGRADILIKGACQQQLRYLSLLSYGFDRPPWTEEGEEPTQLVHVHFPMHGGTLGVRGVCKPCRVFLVGTGERDHNERRARNRSV